MFNYLFLGRVVHDVICIYKDDKEIKKGWKLLRFTTENIYTLQPPWCWRVIRKRLENSEHHRSVRLLINLENWPSSRGLNQWKTMKTSIRHILVWVPQHRTQSPRDRRQGRTSRALSRLERRFENKISNHVLKNKF